MNHPVMNVGATADDGTGDHLRTSFVKINVAFEEMGSRYGAPVEWINVGDKSNSGNGDNLSIAYVKALTNFDRLSGRSGVTLEPLHPKKVDPPAHERAWWQFWKPDHSFGALNSFYPFSRNTFIQINRNFEILDANRPVASLLNDGKTP